MLPVRWSPIRSLSGLPALESTAKTRRLLIWTPGYSENLDAAFGTERHRQGRELFG